jgi:hypothetical protein
MDIKATQAWTVTTGCPDVKVAILDSGVDLTHPDLQNNLLTGYDATGGNNKGNHSGKPHGTACAGIVAARGNNSLGIAGIAYNCRILPIHMGSTPTASHATNGLNWARQNGAKVISMSFHSPIETNDFNTAIVNAYSSGCVLVAAAGNLNAASVNYPASRPEVIAVGAISQCGTRKRSSNNWNDLDPGVQPDPLGVSCDGETWWGSNYGTSLAVVAPGTYIYTTFIQGYGLGGDYYDRFYGTSAACPHVAGVAALVLSVNPNFTVQQVRNIIESTAQKVRTDLYTYSTTSGKPNGTWNNQMGYGLVNAHAAVNKALNLSITGPSLVGYLKTETFYATPLANSCSSNVYCEWKLNGVLVEVGPSVVIQSVKTPTNPPMPKTVGPPTDSADDSISDDDPPILRQPIDIPYANYQLTATAKNSSGTVIASASKTITIYGNYMIIPRLPAPPPPIPTVNSAIIAYPNPTGSVLNVEIDREAIFQTYDIRLYNGQGNLLRQAASQGEKVEFNVGSLPNGIYYLHVYDGINEKPEKRQIVVQH